MPRLNASKSQPHKYCIVTFFTSFTTYSTSRSIKVNNIYVAILHRGVQLLILSYIIGYDIIWNKGYLIYYCGPSQLVYLNALEGLWKFKNVQINKYQITDVASSTVTTKVKGLGYIVDKKVPGGIYVFDSADYVIPPNEFNSIFIMTNFRRSPQTRGICQESITKHDAICRTDADCDDQIINTWNGIKTGKCKQSPENSTIKTCEIIAWCPVENALTDDNDYIIENVLNYTIFIKNDVEFKRFNKKQRNILSNITNEYISQCSYNAIDDPYCPVFTVGNILKEAEPDERERKNMLRKGGIVAIEVSWNCNYDFLTDKCQPQYSFTRFDVPFKDTSTASGFNFRYASRFHDVDYTEHRVSRKVYGLRFMINVSGHAGKFNILPLMITIGYGFGLLSLSDIIADIVLLNLTEKRNVFKRLKELDAQSYYNDHQRHVTRIARNTIDSRKYVIRV